MSRRNADFREALEYCPETCPEVDSAFASLLEDLETMLAPCNQDEARELIEACCTAVKDKGTILLRDALVRACAEKQEIESDRDELADEVRRLSSMVEDLQSEVRDLESQLDEATI